MAYDSAEARLRDALIDLASPDPDRQNRAVIVLMPEVRKRVSRLCRITGAEIDDMAQIAVMKLIDSASAYDSTRQAGPWITTICYRETVNKVKERNQVRKAPKGKLIGSLEWKHDRDGNSVGDTLADPKAPTSLQIALHDEKLRTARQLMHALKYLLSRNEYEAFRLTHTQGETYLEAGRRAGSDAKFADNAICRAEAKINKLRDTAGGDIEVMIDLLHDRRIRKEAKSSPRIKRDKAAKPLTCKSAKVKKPKYTPHPKPPTNYYEQIDEQTSILIVVGKSGQRTRVLIDSADVEKAKAQSWAVYCRHRDQGRPHVRSKKGVLARIICDADPENRVLHINDDPLDCRSANLEQITKGEALRRTRENPRRPRKKRGAYARNRENQYELIDGQTAVLIIRGNLGSQFRVLIDRENVGRVQAQQWRVWKEAAGRIQVRSYDAILARIVCDAPEGTYVLYRNGDRYDCRSANLEVVSKAEGARRATLYRKPPTPNNAAMKNASNGRKISIKRSIKMNDKKPTQNDIKIALYDTIEQLAALNQRQQQLQQMLNAAREEESKAKRPTGDELDEAA